MRRGIRKKRKINLKSHLLFCFFEWVAVRKKYLFQILDLSTQLRNGADSPQLPLQTYYLTIMNLLQKWMSLPSKARYYIAGSTFVFALVGEYVTTKVNEEAVAQKQIMTELRDGQTPVEPRN